jgi:nucleotide-binding universal stress UspA family protein
MYKRILVATDGSTLSKKAVRNAIDLAGAVGADLVALYVVPRYPVSYFEGGVTISMQDVERTEKTVERKRTGRRRCRATGCPGGRHQSQGRRRQV